jgi:hypothetical protein
MIIRSGVTIKEDLLADDDGSHRGAEATLERTTIDPAGFLGGKEIRQEPGDS